MEAILIETRRLKTLTLVLVAVALLLGKPVLAQSGGSSGIEERPAGGFANSSTIFSDVEFKLKRILRDPKDPLALRMVADFINKSDEPRWVLYSLPAPSLIDDFGNQYKINIITGIEACRDNNNRWTTRIDNCDESKNVAQAVKLSPGVPTTTMLRFVGDEQFGYDAELAEMSSTANLKIRVLVSKDGFSDYRKILKHDYVVPAIFLPR